MTYFSQMLSMAILDFWIMPGNIAIQAASNLILRIKSSYYSNIHVVCDHSEGQFFVQRIFPTPLGALQLTICSLDASWAFRKRQIWKTIALSPLPLSICS